MKNTYRSAGAAVHGHERTSVREGRPRAGFLALAASSLICLSGGCSTVPTQGQNPTAAQGKFGTIKADAIEVCKPAGERNYLAHLVCPDGSHPLFDRSGSVGTRHDLPAGMSDAEQMKIMADNMGFEKLAPGAVDYHIVDRYSVKCGETETALYLDMYHCDVSAPALAPAGFTLAD